MSLSGEDRAYLEALRSIGECWQRRVEYLFGAIEHCYERQSMKGFDEMVAYSFNAAGIPANYGTGGGLPVGKHPVVICASALKPTSDNTGGFMELTLEAIDGPAKGAKAIDRLNLNNTSQTAVRIANEQLAAYLAVMGLQGFNDTSEMHGKPFVVEMAAQKSNPQYTEVVALFDMNGRKPGEVSGGGSGGGNQGAGASQQGGGSNAGGNGGGWNNNNAGGQQGGGDNAGGGGQGGGNGNGWGNGGNNAGGGDQQGQGGGNGGGWNQGGGAPANQAGGDQGGGSGGWQQGGGAAGGGSPGWGKPNG